MPRKPTNGDPVELDREIWEVGLVVCVDVKGALVRGRIESFDAARRYAGGKRVYVPTQKIVYAERVYAYERR